MRTVICDNCPCFSTSEQDGSGQCNLKYDINRSRREERHLYESEDCELLVVVTIEKVIQPELK